MPNSTGAIMRSIAARSFAATAAARIDQRYRTTARTVVSRELIREFACAVQDYHPAHWCPDTAIELGFTGLIAPPTFANTVMVPLQEEILDLLVTGYGQRPRVLHVDQVLELRRTLVAGDRVTCAVSVESFRQFADYDVLAIKNVFRDQRGELVQSGSTALLVRSGAPRVEAVRPISVPHYSPTTPGSIDRLPRSTRAPRTTRDLDELHVGSTLPPRETHLARMDLANYARVTGGGPSMVASGSLILGLAAGYLSSRLGDPAAITRLRAQFAHHAHRLPITAGQPRAIEFRGRVIALDTRLRKATIAIDARAAGSPLFGYAAADVRFAERS